MRIRRLTLAIATAALATTSLAACGGGSAGEPDPAVLYGKSFDVTEMSVGGQTAPAPGSTITVTTLEDSVSINAGCNTMNGEATYTATQITVGPIAMTMMACEQALMDQDLVLGTFFEADPQWSLSEGTLTLTVGADSLTLVQQ